MLPWYAVGWDSSVSLAICAHENWWSTCKHGCRAWKLVVIVYARSFGDSSSHANPLTFSLTVVSCNRICWQKSFTVTARGIQWKHIHPRQIKGLNWLSRRRDAQAKDKTMLGSTRDFISALGNTHSGRITRIVIRVAATGKHTSHSQNLGYTEQTPRYWQIIMIMLSFPLESPNDVHVLEQSLMSR